MNALKQTYIERANQHQQADEIVQGIYFKENNGKVQACCIGCLAHDNDNAHEALQEQTNIPIWLSRLSDTIHEGLTAKESKLWPVRFIKAVPEQIFDKSWSENEIDRKVKAPFLIIVLKSALETFDHARYPYVKSAIEGSITLWQRDDIGSDGWKKAAWAAWAAAWEAAWAAWAAAEAAWEAARAAWAAAGAAEAAWEAARAAAGAAAGEAARSEKYRYFSDELVRIMEEACK